MSLKCREFSGVIGHRGEMKVEIPAAPARSRRRRAASRGSHPGEHQGGLWGEPVTARESACGQDGTATASGRNGASVGELENEYWMQEEHRFLASRRISEEQRGQKSHDCGYCGGLGKNEAMERVTHR